MKLYSVFLICTCGENHSELKGVFSSQAKAMDFVNPQMNEDPRLIFEIIESLLDQSIDNLRSVADFSPIELHPSQYEVSAA